MLDSPPKVAADSVTGARTALASIEIPDNAAGRKPKFLLITCRTSVGAFRPILSGETPALGTLARLAIEQPLIIDVSGFTHLRQASYDGSATCDLTMTPLENGGSWERV